MKKERSSLSTDEVLRRSKAITDKLLAMPEYKMARTVMTYVSAFNEPRTNDIISDALTCKRVIVPISNVEDCTIIPSYIASPADLMPGAYGIMEPKGCAAADINDIDIAVIPGIAFDRSGFRIGFGKGYYDKFLAGFSGVKIGLCYEFQICGKVPRDAHDVGMDIIITEERIYNDF